MSDTTQAPAPKPISKAAHGVIYCDPETTDTTQPQPQPQPQPPKPILKAAHAIIYGDREQTYGDPGKNLRVIAAYWKNYLFSRFGVTVDVQYDDVANMMALLKLARLGHTPLHVDSMVDACGYLALADRVHNADTQTQESASPPAP